jgi:hypothetical protein
MLFNMDKRKKRSANTRSNPATHRIWQIIRSETIIVGRGRGQDGLPLLSSNLWGLGTTSGGGRDRSKEGGSILGGGPSTGGVRGLMSSLFNNGVSLPHGLILGDIACGLGARPRPRPLSTRHSPSYTPPQEFR